jgi:hypothetical protein
MEWLRQAAVSSCCVRTLTGSMAVVLSLLMVLTTASAPACDLSCRLSQAHYGCHSAAPTQGNQEITAPMPPGMDMGSMSMGASRTDMPSEMRAGSGTRSGGSGMAHHLHPQSGTRTTSSCAHEVCSQISAPSSSLSTDQAPLTSLHFAIIKLSNPPNLWMGSHQAIAANAPQPLTVDRLITTLRI